MGSGNVEEVTCTVIGGVTYNPVCESDSKIRTAEDEDSMTGALHSEKALHLCGCYFYGIFAPFYYSDSAEKSTANKGERDGG